MIESSIWGLCRRSCFNNSIFGIHRKWEQREYFLPPYLFWHWRAFYPRWASCSWGCLYWGRACAQTGEKAMLTSRYYNFRIFENLVPHWIAVESGHCCAEELYVTRQKLSETDERLGEISLALENVECVIWSYKVLIGFGRELNRSLDFFHEMWLWCWRSECRKDLEAKDAHLSKTIKELESKSRDLERERKNLEEMRGELGVSQSKMASVERELEATKRYSWKSLLYYPK